MHQHAIRTKARGTAGETEQCKQDRIRDYYCTPRSSDSGDLLSIYEIWERGRAFNDSVTPSTYCQEYRSHMVLKIASLATQHDRVFSIGCGNGFVEADLVSRGLQVQAIDCNTEAVILAGSKGVDAFESDYFALPPGHLSDFGVVYADGLLGHLYRADGELDPFFEMLAALKPRAGCWLVFSNDAPLEASLEVAPHGRVSDFWLLSKEYLAKVLSQVGCQNWESYHFPYVRPISGLRNRTICVARVAEGPLARS